MISILSIFENVHVCNLRCLAYVVSGQVLLITLLKFLNYLLIVFFYIFYILLRGVFQSPVMTVDLSISSFSSVK